MTEAFRDTFQQQVVNKNLDLEVGLDSFLLNSMYSFDLSLYSSQGKRGDRESHGTLGIRGLHDPNLLGRVPKWPLKGLKAARLTYSVDLPRLSLDAACDLAFTLAYATWQSLDRFVFLNVSHSGLSGIVDGPGSF